MTNEKHVRRSGAVIMASLITLLGSLAYIMILAVINGSVGFIVAMGVTLMGAVGIAKSLGEAIPLSYGHNHCPNNRLWCITWFLTLSRTIQ